MHDRSHNLCLRICASLLIVLTVPHAPTLPAQQVPPNGPPTQPSTPPPAPTAQLQVRVYEGFNRLGPVYGSRETPMAVDVGMGLTTCPDGNTEIDLMNIGGWLYHVGGTCASSRSGSIRVGTPQQQTPVTAPPPAPAAGAHVIRCDPTTWRCTSTAP